MLVSRGLLRRSVKPMTERLLAGVSMVALAVALNALGEGQPARNPVSSSGADAQNGYRVASMRRARPSHSEKIIACDIQHLHLETSLTGMPFALDGSELDLTAQALESLSVALADLKSR